MKSLFIALLSFVGFILFTAPAANALAAQVHTSPVLVEIGFALAVFAVTAASKPSLLNVHTAGVEKEAWVDYIIKRFWKDNGFLTKFASESNKVLNGRVVHIPNPGAKPTAVKNRSVFPAVAVRRTDSDISYLLDEYSIDPIHIHELEKVELSYDKLNDVYGDQLGVLNDAIAEDTIIKIMTGITAPNIVHTSGGKTGDTTEATLIGATGMRKLSVHQDIRKVNLRMNTTNVPKNDRVGLLEENMADQIFGSLSDTENRNFTQYANAETGVLGRLYGFDIMTRSSVAAATNADAIRAFGAAILPTDNAASIFWQKGCVAFALGEIKIFDDTDNPLYFGDIISTSQRSGARRRRADDLGVVALIQGAA